MTEARQGYLRPGNPRTVSEHSPVRVDLQRSNSYDGRVVLPLSGEYTHQTYTETNEPKHSRASLYTGKFEAFIKRNHGLLLVAASQVFFAGMNVFAKLLANPTDPTSPPVSTFQLIFVRMSLTWLFAILYMIYTKVPNYLLGPKEVRGLLILRSSVGFGGLFSIYYSLQYLPLSDATVLTFLTPCFTLVLGYFFLGESFTRREALAGLVALLGVVFIARPLSFFGIEADGTDTSLPIGDLPTNSTIPGNIIPKAPYEATEAQRLSAVCMSLVGVVGAGGAYVTIRYIGKRAHALISVSMFSLFACIFSAGGLIITRQPVVLPHGMGLAYLAALGTSGFVAQFLLTMGLQREKAGRGSTAMYLQLFFAMFWEKVVFGTLPDFWSLCGIMLILCSTVYVAVMTSSAPSSKPAAVGATMTRSVSEAGSQHVLSEMAAVNNEEAMLDGDHGDSDDENDEVDGLLPTVEPRKSP